MTADQNEEQPVKQSKGNEHKIVRTGLSIINAWLPQAQYG